MLELKNISLEVSNQEAAGENSSTKEILQNVSLTLPDNKFIAITGPNGGGKSTLAKVIAGIEKPSHGQILWDGQDITDMSITDRARKGIAYAFQQPVRFKGLTVRDLLELAAKDKLADDELCRLLEKVGLCADEYIDREMNASLSGGESKRIEIATVLARNARLSIFDEPEAGIDLWSFSRLVETFQEIKKRHEGTLLIISHQERILSIADEIVVLADGKVRTSGAKEDILPKLLEGEKAVRCPLGKGGS